VIPRYEVPEIADVWSDRTRMANWLEIELLAVEAWSELGVVPEADARACRERASFTVEAVNERERVTRHDVAAFVDVVAASIGEPGRWIHFGMTSSDVTDTGLALQLRAASDVALADLERLVAAVKRRALEHRDTICIGRTHGVHAEPTSFGHKLAVFAFQLDRDRERLRRARETVSVGVISGVVGSYASVDPRVEERVCARLGLRPAEASTQVIQRDRHAEYVGALAVCASTLEAIATEIRHLARTEVREVQEPFAEGQKGSSAMPHKRNPILTENLCGLARLVRGYGQVALENVPLWHERDISHSSAERVIGPDATIVMDFMLARLAGIVEGMEVRPESMKRNLELTGGAPFSESLLLALVRKGLSRDAAYALVQPHALAAAAGQGTFLAFVLGDATIRRSLSEQEIRSTIDVEHALRYVDLLFARVFGES
jgi:adenylosuccinate lyase